MWYVVCVCHVGGLAGELTGWLAGRRPYCSLCASCSPSRRDVRAGLDLMVAREKHDDTYAIYTSNYARGKIYAKLRAPFYH